MPSNRIVTLFEKAKKHELFANVEQKTPDLESLNRMCAHPMFRSRLLMAIPEIALEATILDGRIQISDNAADVDHVSGYPAGFDYTLTQIGPETIKGLREPVTRFTIGALVKTLSHKTLWLPVSTTETYDVEYELQESGAARAIREILKEDEPDIFALVQIVNQLDPNDTDYIRLIESLICSLVRPVDCLREFQYYVRIMHSAIGKNIFSTTQIVDMAAKENDSFGILADKNFPVVLLTIKLDCPGLPKDEMLEIIPIIAKS